MAVCGDGGRSSRVHCDKSDDVEEKKLRVVVQRLYETGVYTLNPSKQTAHSGKSPLSSILFITGTHGGWSELSAEDGYGDAGRGSRVHSDTSDGADEKKQCGTVL